LIKREFNTKESLIDFRYKSQKNARFARAGSYIFIRIEDGLTEEEIFAIICP